MIITNVPLNIDDVTFVLKSTNFPHINNDFVSSHFINGLLNHKENIFVLIYTTTWDWNWMSNYYIYKKQHKTNNSISFIELKLSHIKNIIK